jgi:uncharacterized protein
MHVHPSRYADNYRSVLVNINSWSIFAVRLKLSSSQVVKALKEYRIPFIGLKPGLHNYSFTLNDAFFEAFKYSEIEHASIEVALELDKRLSMLVLHFILKGEVESMCDRCGDPLLQPLSGTHELIVKFGEESVETDDDLIILGPAESHIDVSQFLYEYAHLDLPARHVHASQEDCNQAVLNELQRYSVAQDSNDQWIALKDMHHAEELDEDFMLDDEEE